MTTIPNQTSPASRPPSRMRWRSRHASTICPCPAMPTSRSIMIPRPTSEPRMANEHRTLDLHEAAAFLHMSPAVLREKARRGLIQGGKPGKCWVFLEADLVAYLRSLYPDGGRTPLSGKEETQCHYTNAVIPGGFGSPLPTDSEYASLLGLETERRPRNTMTD
ncbi:MAG: DNA-binding protein [Gammaproteobacteria bacterium]|nr:MAG: DNA-binding protein [Gammaproteobacteria bacterium]